MIDRLKIKLFQHLDEIHCTKCCLWIHRFCSQSESLGNLFENLHKLALKSVKVTKKATNRLHCQIVSACAKFLFFIGNRNFYFWSVLLRNKRLVLWIAKILEKFSFLQSIQRLQNKNFLKVANRNASVYFDVSFQLKMDFSQKNWSERYSTLKKLW